MGLFANIEEGENNELFWGWDGVGKGTIWMTVWVGLEQAAINEVFSHRENMWKSEKMQCMFSKQVYVLRKGG